MALPPAGTSSAGGVGHKAWARAFERMMGTVSEHTDETLLGLTPTSGAAFGVFYDRHHLAVLVGVRRRVSDVEVALDLTAEIFAVALQRCESFRSQGAGSAKAWLYAIVRNRGGVSVRRGGTRRRPARAGDRRGW